MGRQSVMIAVAIAAFGAGGCHRQSHAEDAQVVGAWRFQQLADPDHQLGPVQTKTLTQANTSRVDEFKSDNTYTVSSNNGQPSTGTWSASGGTITMTSAPTPNGARARDTASLSSDGTTLSFDEGGGGVKLVFEKMHSLPQ